MGLKKPPATDSPMCVGVVKVQKFLVKLRRLLSFHFRLPVT